MAKIFAPFVLLATLLVASAVSTGTSPPTSTTYPDGSCPVEVLSEHLTDVGAQSVKGEHNPTGRGVTLTQLSTCKQRSFFQVAGTNVDVVIENHPGLTGTTKFIMEMNAISDKLVCFQVMEKGSDSVVGMCCSCDCGGNVNRSAAGPINARRADVGDSSPTLWIRFRVHGNHVHDIVMDESLLYGKVVKFTLRMA